MKQKIPLLILQVDFNTYRTLCSPRQPYVRQERLRLHMSQMAHQAKAYPSFCSMKRLGVFPLPPGWDASPLQGHPQHKIRRYPFLHQGLEWHCES